jgi:phytoene dehydrogenase-like protein
MHSLDNDSYDVIIIGAGISGLVCGCYLAKAGMKVLIVEQHDKPGGYCTSFKRNGFLFDAAAHSFGGYRETGHVRKIFNLLNLNRILKIDRLDPSDVIITSDFKITFWSDTNKTISELINFFPQEEKNIVRFFNFLTSTDQSSFVTLKNKTFLNLLETFFKDEKLISILSVTVLGNGGLPPSQIHAFTGTKILSEFILDGGYYPQGGMQALPNALAQLIIDAGGSLSYRHPVKKINHRNGKVTGVTLNNGQSYITNCVISACDMLETLDQLLDKSVIDQSMMSVIKALIPSLSTFVLYIGIDQSISELPSPGSNTWYLMNYDLNQVYMQISKCDLSNAGMYMLRVSPDTKTILMFINAPFKSPDFWKKNKETIASSFLDRLKQVIPNLDKHIKYFDAASPATLFRYTLNHQGAAYGWAGTLSQSFHPGVKQINHCKGLFFTGHWTNIAAGLPGAIYSGYDVAKKIIKKTTKTS